MLIAAEALGPVASNIPLAGQPALDADLRRTGHTFIDFGDDQLTVGRPHPMIDADAAARAAAPPSSPTDDCAVVLLDVVLGHGAHPDPAAELAAVDRGRDEARSSSRSSAPATTRRAATHTADRLADAGAIVHASNAAAAREARRR